MAEFIGRRQGFPEVVQASALPAGTVVLVAAATLFWPAGARFRAGPIKALRK